MPRLARIFIKTGLIYFLASLLLGFAAEFKWFTFPGITPLFWHLLMVGWITQIIFGVSMWMFPGRTKEEGFWPQKWGWLTYILLNVGLICRLIAGPASYTSNAELWSILLVISGAGQVMAAGAYTIELWPRIQSKEQRRKQRKKKRKQAKK
jgi:hypothetical protein